MELLQGADIQFKRQHRLDVALVQNFPMALVFLPAADIPRFVGLGKVDLGITGQDMVAESGPDISSQVSEVLPLGFGKCKLQVQVPDPALQPRGSAAAQSPLKSVQDLIGSRIATSFDQLAGQYFSKLESEAQSTKKTEIQFVSGSVETACALGIADAIVDLVESGETMRACGLAAIATLLESQAVLIRSAVPHARSDTKLINLISNRLRGVIAAQRYVLCTYNITKQNLPAALEITPGRRAATVMPLEDETWNAVSAMIVRSEAANIMDRLEAAGASDILITTIANSRA